MKPQSTLVALVAVALLAAACGRSGSSGEEDAPSQAAQAVSSDFGDLKSVCQPGKPTSSPAQGVTKDQIKVSTFSDIGFTKNPEFVDTAKVFTTWCNAAGGINGRKIAHTIRDAKLMEARPRMLEACREDFASVGGGAALDGTAVKDRLGCLLPEFPGQTSSLEANGADLQVYQLGAGHSYGRYAGEIKWLLSTYPGSKSGVGVLAGDTPLTKNLGAQTAENVQAEGGTVGYTDYFPSQGVTDWTPYAQAIKNKKVKGLIFYGSFADLAKLEQVLTNIGYKLDWIDPNSNAYGPAFLQLAGAKTLAYQNNVTDLSGVYPLEEAAKNPATKQLMDLFAKYAPKARVTMPAVRGFSAWLLFAKAAASCGDQLTRKCVYEAARKETAWSGGGLTAPVDLSSSDKPLKCFNMVKATPQGWTVPDFGAGANGYRCDAPVYKFTGKYTQPLTLAAVGKSMSDLK